MRNADMLVLSALFGFSICNAFAMSRSIYSVFSGHFPPWFAHNQSLFRPINTIVRSPSCHTRDQIFNRQRDGLLKKGVQIFKESLSHFC